MAYQFGPFRYDPASRSLVRGDREVALRPKARDLLVLFLKNPHRLLTHDEISERLWPDTAVTDDAVRLQVFELRKALGENGDRMIKTLPREGYRWETDVRSRSGAGVAAGELLCRLILAKREVELPEGEHVLGRDEGVAVWIDDGAVSRHHARIVVSPGGATLEDLGSKNGTLLRGRKIAGTAPLRDGDVIVVGPETMTFRALRRGGTTQTKDSQR